MQMPSAALTFAVACVVASLLIYNFAWHDWRATVVQVTSIDGCDNQHCAAHVQAGVGDPEQPIAVPSSHSLTVGETVTLWHKEDWSEYTLTNVHWRRTLIALVPVVVAALVLVGVYSGAGRRSPLELKFATTERAAPATTAPVTIEPATIERAAPATIERAAPVAPAALAAPETTAPATTAPATTAKAKMMSKCGLPPHRSTDHRSLCSAL